MNDTYTNLINLIKANTRIIQIISYETLLIHANLVQAARELDREFYVWNRIEGIRKWNDDTNRLDVIDEDARQPDHPFEFFAEHEKLILLLEDFHPDMTDNHPESIRRLRNVAMGREPDKTLVLSQPFRFLPRELEKEVHILEMPLPPYAELETVFENVCQTYGIEPPSEPDHELIELFQVISQAA
jgi:hypothetical protein